ncbi:GNAT family N-acetyltransferase [Paenibacillus glycanilyticus]|uniref:GNAT family N-acetyltransferase n=1 Tax=Paenibacillus glycanilyticus TaxID=126569 RepID=UPI00203E814A|nr:GNAT family N-acetyltransferase [Paenibacillus glycanilyticus]MCM3629785.1 GNAT family N-acetyltransferase [Paenibacillus glycanilyticus]
METALDSHVHIAIEKVEQEAWFDLFAAAADSKVQNSSVSSMRLGTNIALADPGTPISEFNRVLGLGIEKPASEADLAQATTWMREHAAPSFALQIAPTALPSNLEKIIQANGFYRTGNGWAKYYRDAAPAESHPMPSTLEVKLMLPQHAADFGHVVHAGFGLPESMIPWFSALVGRPKWSVYVAYESHVPVACGAMFIDKNWAWFGIDATLPEYRGRGAQNALIKQRITDGIAAGVIGFTAETGQPSEGEEDNNKSYCNYHRAAFKRLYIRPNYVTK